jgi:serine/threonine-protein kinase
VPLLTSSERLGTRVGARYELRSVVGEGASAVLFCAQDTVLGREVGVKIMRPGGAFESKNAQARFHAEAQTLAKLRHAHLVEVFDMGATDDGMPYLVVELLHGETLAGLLERRAPLSVEETLAMLLPLMGALAFVHQAGVIHRDIKPANIFLQRAGNGARIPKLLDFGIAKLASENPALTTEGMTLGTPAFMAPEQARGEVLGPAADVWAMGVTLYLCLSGRLPFDASTAAGVLWQATQRGAAPLERVEPGIALAVERALAPEPTRRLESMHALARALVQTARRAAINLPLEPDPVGLPDYRAWCSLTDLDPGTEQLPAATGHALRPSTEPENQAVPSGVASSSRLPVSSPRRRLHVRLALALGLVGLLAWAASASLRARSEEAEPSPQDTHLPIAQPSLPRAAPEDPPSPVQAPLAPAAAAPVDPPLPAQALTDAPTSATTHKRARSAPPSPRAGKPPKRAPKTTENPRAKPGHLVEQWDW